jgi:predicted nucleic acid-binding protein
VDQVIDASVILAWFVRSQADAMTAASLEAATDGGGHIPAHALFEVFHGLAGLERRRLMSKEAVDGFVGRIGALPLNIDRSYDPTEMAKLHDLSRHAGLSIYDASYLELALRLDLPLATRDVRLATAAQKAGAKLFAP